MKCFLSHSSKDKERYVRIVARKLNPRISYDEITFEEGMDTLDEILRGISNSDIFVVFLSEDSLSSDWVKNEILIAKGQLEAKYLNRFFPIIIDRSISHRDPRIPDWVRNRYNLKPITKPTLAAKRIREKLIEASWSRHPELKEKQNIFVGRNHLLGEIEVRFDDVTKPNPIVFCASGLREVGRKSTMLRALKKANIFRESYEPLRLVLETEDGIESLIVKLYDMGFSKTIDVTNLLDRKPSEKEELCAKLLNDISDIGEIIFIDDNNCLVRNGNEFVSWFTSLINRLKSDMTVLCIASTVRASLKGLWRNQKYYSVEIPELEVSERNGLFTRYLKVLKISISRQRIQDFCSLLTGYPEQVTFAADSIKQFGITDAWKHSDSILNFSTERAGAYIRKYEDDKERLSFLRFISSFEFISLEFLDEIANHTTTPVSRMFGYLNDFDNDSICERIGVSGEYFRVNNVIRDFILRNDYYIEDSYKNALSIFADDFIKTFKTGDFDVSEYQIAVKEALSSNRDVPDSLLTPALFLKSMKELYRNKRNDDVIILADRVLQKSENYDLHTEQDVRYYLCQSLAHLRADRFLSEVQKISGAEHNFLMGFFYRLKGNYPRALEYLEKAVGERRTIQRARQEIVLILIRLEKYRDALSLAKENYEKYPHNALIMQAYFRCLVFQEKTDKNREILNGLLSSLKGVSGDKAGEIQLTNEAIFSAAYDSNYNRSFDVLNEAEAKFSNIVYPVLARLDIAIWANDEPELIKALDRLANKFNRNSLQKHQIAKGQAILAAMQNDQVRAERILNNELNDFGEEAKNKLRRKIQFLASR